VAQEMGSLSYFGWKFYVSLLTFGLNFGWYIRRRYQRQISFLKIKVDEHKKNEEDLKNQVVNLRT
jgi:hypothetical protein